MSKKVVGLIFLIAVIICAGLTYYLFFGNTKVTDAEKFSKEYTSVSKKNVFVYKNTEDVVKILENGTGAVFFGFAECPWCQEYAPKLNEVALDLGVLEIYYCDIKEDRANNTKNYQKIVQLLGDNLYYDNEGNHRIYVPEVVVVKSGEILGHNNETCMATEEKNGKPKDYWTKEKTASLKEKLEVMFQPLIDDVCTDCNK